MASSGNFATWNPLANTQAGLSYSEGVYSNGNTRFRGNTGGTTTTQLTHGLSSGKWYIEIYIDGSPASGFPMIGIVANGVNTGTLQNTSNAGALAITSDLQTVNGTKRVFGSTSSTSYGSGFSDGDICQMAIDIDNGKIWWGKNNTWFASGDPAAGSNAGDTFTGGTEMMVFVGSYSGAAYSICNAGQDDTFAGNVTAAGNADGNGFGVFKYSPPTGFLALCSGNLPVSADIDPAGDDGETENSAKQFNQILYTGSGAAQTISGLGFKPDLVWAKMYTSSQNNQLFDSVRLNSRSTPNMLRTDTTTGELDDQSTGNTNKFISAFNDDGFVLGNSGSGPNDNARGYLAWCWKAGGAPTATNSAGAGATPTSGSVKIDGSNLGSALAGTIPATKLTANTKGGFSIATFTGTGSNGTVAHGLNNAPAFVLVKKYSADGNNWCIFHQGLASANTSRIFFTTAGRDSGGGTSWNSTAPSSSVISLGTNGNVNSSGPNYIIYSWSEIEGYSKFSSYTGNGNADGTFVYTGFRPALVFTKWYATGASAEDWGVFDTKRATYNPTSAHSYGQIQWNITDGGSAGSSHGVDFLSNGFKLRGTGGLNNASGGQYIYGAWSSVPFRYNNTF